MAELCCGPGQTQELASPFARFLERIQIWLTAICGLFLVLSWLTAIPGFFNSLGGVFAGIACAAGSVFALRSAFTSLASRSLDVNMLMVLAAIGAILVGHVDDAAVLLFLFSLSSTLEHLAMSKTQSAIEALVRLRPDTSLRVGPGGDETVSTDSLVIGDFVRVRPSEVIPTDGILTTESATIDEASMTGESVPVAKRTGDQLLAGTQNLDQMLVLQVTVQPGNSTIERVVTLVQEAQENKASGEKISAWFGARYTLFVLGMFVVSLIVRMAMGATLDSALYNALILLVALSPCALVISSPAASLSALAFAARNGVLVRGGQYLEDAGNITMVALDKTGTLTQGKPKVIEICVGKPELVAAGGHQCAAACALRCDCISCWHAGDDLAQENREALAFAASAEAYSTHPVAVAIVEAARDAGLEIAPAETHHDFPGLGIEAQVDGQAITIGQKKFFADKEHAMPKGFADHVDEMRQRGLTAILMKFGEQWAAIGLRDEPRPGVQEFLNGLRESGVKRIAMLTGDNAATAAAIAGPLGLTEVHSALMPAEKHTLIQQFTAEGERVMMVGDGVNDAPALSSASVGVAMGGLGSDVALRAADVVLVQDRLARLPVLIRLGQKTNRIIRANLLFASGIIILLTIGSFFGKVPLPLAVFGHEGSTLVVVLNGIRLLRGVK